VIQKRSTKCKGCGGVIAVGEQSVRLRLKKSYRHPCATCNQTPPGAKRFHVACLPTDINAAMGYTGQAPVQPAYNPRQASAPPPPLPPSLQDLSLTAIAALEAACVAKARKMGVTPEMEKGFKTFQNIKARVLKPGTEGEGEAATTVALKRIIDLVFGGVK
jgi:hypothetical protein